MDFPQMPEEELRALYDSGIMHREEPLQPRAFKPLDDDIGKAIEKMRMIDEIEATLPGLDCGSCGAPSCRAFAEDIVKGFARKIDCIFILRDRVKALSRLTNEMLQTGQPVSSEEEEDTDESE